MVDGRINTKGMRIQCQHCGYVWNTQSQEDVTSCPKCGWRVRLRPSRRKSVPASQALTTSRERRSLLTSDKPREPLI